MKHMPFEHLGNPTPESIGHICSMLTNPLFWFAILLFVAYLHYCWTKMTPEEKLKFRKEFNGEKV